MAAIIPVTPIPLAESVVPEEPEWATAERQQLTIVAALFVALAGTTSAMT